MPTQTKPQQDQDPRVFGWDDAAGLIGAGLGLFGGGGGNPWGPLDDMGNMLMDLVNEQMGYLRTVDFEARAIKARDEFRRFAIEDAQKSLTNVSAGMGDNALQSDSFKALRDASVAASGTRGANEWYAGEYMNIPGRKLAAGSQVIGNLSNAFGPMAQVAQGKAQRQASKDRAIYGLFDQIGNTFIDGPGWGGPNRRFDDDRGGTQGNYGDDQFSYDY